VIEALVAGSVSKTGQPALQPLFLAAPRLIPADMSRLDLALGSGLVNVRSPSVDKEPAIDLIASRWTPVRFRRTGEPVGLICFRPERGLDPEQVNSQNTTATGFRTIITANTALVNVPVVVTSRY
jgi:hypothetical protein